MNTLPTAKEFAKQHHPMKTYPADWNVMIEFAKLHVEAALKSASEESTINKNKGQITAREFLNVLDGSYSINKQSILNSYPLDNIE